MLSELMLDMLREMHKVASTEAMMAKRMVAKTDVAMAAWLEVTLAILTAVTTGNAKAVLTAV